MISYFLEKKAFSSVKSIFRWHSSRGAKTRHNIERKPKNEKYIQANGEKGVFITL